MKKFLTAYKQPVMFRGYPFNLYILIDDVSEALNLKIIATHHTTEYATSMFAKKGVYQISLPDTNQSFIVYLAATLADGELQVTEKLECAVQDNCSGVFLRWENDIAGYDHWLFSGNEIDIPSSDTSEIFHSFKEDIENETDNFEIVKKDYSESLRVFTFFEKQNKEGFKQLARSRNVEMRYNGKWWKVDVSMRNFTLSKHQPYGKCSIDLILPKTYVK